MSTEEYYKLLDEEKILLMKDVRECTCIFTGKVFKPETSEFKDKLVSIDAFKKGDRVIIFNYEDFFKWDRGMDL